MQTNSNHHPYDSERKSRHNLKYLPKQTKRDGANFRLVLLGKKKKSDLLYLYCKVLKLIFLFLSTKIL